MHLSHDMSSNPTEGANVCTVHTPLCTHHTVFSVHLPVPCYLRERHWKKKTNSTSLYSKPFKNTPPYAAYASAGDNFLSDTEGINRNSGT